MSRHLLLDRPDRHVVLGFDQQLQSFFGQVFRGPASGPVGNACGGWPTRSGLGGRRPVASSAQKANDLSELSEWAKAQIPDEFATEPQAAYYLGLLIGLLSLECNSGEDAPKVPLPACLRGPRA
ncbi:hypothetical protein SAMN02799622_00901 [Methylobacterium sp. UNC378MF]|uniref:hypothetical protein n=1 Tax=Methylobacterium sp. UNC378MF TaxID=1502748 RepID=UPI000886E12F|nr:hypothetical protein [Methylobacterium sp. UNC378MF]SDA13073.1 hypothetical protein SAMN02799622_00901 [Methylobacterium sp. UNC378MF]